MKKTKIALLALFIGVILLLSGCASTAQVKLSEKYSERFEQTYLGMSLDEFKQIWPDAKFYSSDQLSNSEIWKFSEPYIPYVSMVSGQGTSMILFSFQESKLINYSEMSGSL